MPDLPGESFKGFCKRSPADAQTGCLMQHLCQDGMEILNETSPEVIDARKGVVEFLLINHPLDCPVCDQAGECAPAGSFLCPWNVESRYEFEKRTFEKRDLGDKIQLHMNRCILCYRCVYVADQLTPGRVHGVLNRGDVSEISTYIEKAVDNDFSGNMIDVCPVGALTDKTFRFKSRVWFTRSGGCPSRLPCLCGKGNPLVSGQQCVAGDGQER